MAAVLLVTPRVEEVPEWERLVREHVPNVDFRAYPEIGDPDEIEIALAWKPPPGVLARLPRLKLICSLGMGIDHLLDDPSLPTSVPVVRLVDPDMIRQLGEYALYAVLHFHRHFDVYERFQHECRWQELPLPHTAARRVGVMGIGEVGEHCARRLADAGFRVFGWSRTPKRIDAVKCFHGSEALTSFLREAEILLVALPLTPRTVGIVNARALSALPSGAYLVNIARGGLVVEADLIDALDSGQLAGAFLDVTEHEPLPQEHPLWRHPKVRLTPHIAGLTNPRTAIEIIADNIRRLHAGQPLLHRVDFARGY